MLTAIVLLGFSFDFTNLNFERMGFFFLVLFGVGCIWLIPAGKLRTTCGMLAVGLSGWSITKHLQFESSGLFDGVIPVAIPIVAIACFTLGLRLFGFRVLNLTGRYTDRNLEIGTGRDIDQWIQFLDRMNAVTLDRVGVVKIIREDGAPFLWQRIVTDAYEIVRGRVLVGVDEVGRPQTIAAGASVGWSDIFSRRDGRMRWSIKQMLFLSVVVAVLAGVINALEVPFPDLLFALILVAVSISCGVIATAVAYAFLSVGRRWRVDVACYCIVAITSLLATMSFPVLGIGFAPQENALVYGSFVFFGIAFGLACILVRHQGYRLVLVGRGKSPNETCERQERSVERTNPVDSILPTA